MYPDPFVRRWSRRAVTHSAAYGGFLLMLVTLPVWLLTTLIVDAFRRVHLSTTRAMCFVFSYLFFQIYGTGLSFFAWVADLLLPGRTPDRLARWMFPVQFSWGKLLGWSGIKLFGLTIHLQEDYTFAGKRPVILFTRHASITDTFVPMLFVAAKYNLPLKYVMKRELEWDPCLDVAINRMPHLFVVRKSKDSQAEVDAIGCLMDGVGPREGVIIFPEGTRFTPKKRERIIQKLEEAGDTQTAKWARSFQHTLPPRLGGPLALLEHATGADIVFCAHTGLEKSASFGESFNGSLVGAQVYVRFFGVSIEDIPKDEAGRRQWLMEQWAKVDDWVAQHAETPENTA